MRCGGPGVAALALVVACAAAPPVADPPPAPAAAPRATPSTPVSAAPAETAPSDAPEVTEADVERLLSEDPVGSGDRLLEYTASQEPQVAGLAAQGLLRVKHPAEFSRILAALRSREDPFVRGWLYRAAAATGDTTRIQALRLVAGAERDQAAAADAQVALVKLGGQAERAAFFARVKDVGPDGALAVADQLRYIANPSIAKALLPWLSRREEIMRLGGDRQGQMARMCDLAVWLAHELGVKLAKPPTHLTRFGDAELRQAKAALQALP